MSKLNLRDRLEEGELDLSMSDLEDVPVKEINAIKKARTLDLSNNRITKLGKNFATMTHIVKLDLGKNLLTELPENFGDLVQLRHLDLYSNKIDRLPLSFGRLKNLRWLDLKGNPLVPKLAEVAGPCLDALECANCARAVVTMLRDMAVAIEEEKARREQQRQSRQTEAQSAVPLPSKKEGKKRARRSKGGDAVEEGPKRTLGDASVEHQERGLGPELQNGRSHTEKTTVQQKKGHSIGRGILFLVLPILMLALSGLILFVADRNLFWSSTEATSVFCKELVTSISEWWQAEGLQGVKDWAGGGLEAAKYTILRLYDSVSSQIPIYLNSARKIF